jgi:hypothetical protein
LKSALKENAKMVSALSALMQEKFNALKEYRIIEYKKYPWYDPVTKKISSMGRWAYPNVKTKSTPDGTVKLEWEIDAQTVKALERRGLIKPIDFGVDARGKIPIRYEICE